MEIPVENHSKDIVFTSTVLQHNIDDEKVRRIISELCRVSSDIVLLCEDTSPKKRELHAHFVSRPVDFYKNQVEENGHEFRSAEDRKSTRLNSSHVASSYAVFCSK